MVSNLRSCQMALHAGLGTHCWHPNACLNSVTTRQKQLDLAAGSRVSPFQKLAVIASSDRAVSESVAAH